MFIFSLDALPSMNILANRSLRKCGAVKEIEKNWPMDGLRTRVISSAICLTLPSVSFETDQRDFSATKKTSIVAFSITTSNWWLANVSLRQSIVDHFRLAHLLQCFAIRLITDSEMSVLCTLRYPSSNSSSPSKLLPHPENKKISLIENGMVIQTLHFEANWSPPAWPTWTNP